MSLCQMPHQHGSHLGYVVSEIHSFMTFTLFNPIHAGRIRPLRFFLHNSKTPGDIKKKLSDFNFTPLTDILRILTLTIVVRFCNSNLLFPVCHVIFWVEKTKIRRIWTNLGKVIAVFRRSMCFLAFRFSRN